MFASTHVLNADLEKIVTRAAALGRLKPKQLRRAAADCADQASVDALRARLVRLAAGAAATPILDAPRTLVDAVATYDATDAVTLVLTFDWGKQQRTSGDPDLYWNGAAFYTNCALSDQWRVIAA